MTTKYRVVLDDGTTVDIHADSYRTPTPVDEQPERELYFHTEGNSDPVATFPAKKWQAVYEAKRNRPSK